MMATTDISLYTDHQSFKGTLEDIIASPGSENNLAPLKLIVKFTSHKVRNHFYPNRKKLAKWLSRRKMCWVFSPLI